MNCACGRVSAIKLTDNKPKGCGVCGDIVMRRKDVAHIEPMHYLALHLRSAWCAETAYPACARDWTPSNPSYGQCAITALLVQMIYGGKICYDVALHHYWNSLDGQETDLTRQQFPPGTVVRFSNFADPEEMLWGERGVRARTAARLFLLIQRLKEKECL